VTFPHKKPRTNLNSRQILIAIDISPTSNKKDQNDEDKYLDNDDEMSLSPLAIAHLIIEHIS